MENIIYFINPRGEKKLPECGEKTHSELAMSLINDSKELNKIYTDLCRMNTIYNDYLTDPIYGTSNFLMLYGYVKCWQSNDMSWYTYSSQSIKGTVLEELINRLKHMKEKGNQEIELEDFFSEFPDHVYEKMLEYILNNKNKGQSIDEDDFVL